MKRSEPRTIEEDLGEVSEHTLFAEEKKPLIPPHLIILASAIFMIVIIVFYYARFIR